MLNKLVIIGCGESLETAHRIARSSNFYEQVECLEINSGDEFNFNLPDMGSYPAEEWGAFVAIDERGLNLSRALLVSQMKGVGYELQRLIASTAVVANTVRIGQNTIIGDNCCISNYVKIGYNTIIKSLVSVGSDCIIGNSSYLGRASCVEEGAKISDFVTIGASVKLIQGSSIGKYSELRRGNQFDKTIPARTFYIEPFPNPVSIISPL